MKKYHFIFTAGILLLAGFLAISPSEFIPNQEEKNLRHVVLLNLNEQAGDSVLIKMEEDLQALKEAIPQIKEMEFGANIQNDADYTHCMLLTFENVESLHQYEQHPQHLKFASTFGKYVNKKTEVDYWQ